MEYIYQIWDDLADLGSDQFDQSMNLFMSRLCSKFEAINASWCGITQLNKKHTKNFIEGWKFSTKKFLYPISFYNTIKKIEIHESNAEYISTLKFMRNFGKFRTYSFRNDLPERWFSEDFFKKNYEKNGIYDVVFISFPIDSRYESHFEFYGSKKFETESIKKLSYAVRGIKWFHRELLLNHGLAYCSVPLIPSERKVLKFLLTDASEKQIAINLNLEVSTVHQYIVGIYKKFEVHNRAGLMALWLKAVSLENSIPISAVE